MSKDAKLQAAIAVLFLLGTAPTSLFAEAVFSRYLDQSVLVFRAEDVEHRRIPARIHVHGAPLVFGSQVNLACLATNFRRDRLIVFLPESRSCIPFSELDPGRLNTIERDRSSIERGLDGNTFVVLKSQPRIEGGAGLCDCPGNRPPGVIVESGSPQEAEAGAAVTSIEFSASDVDSEVLSETFSFTLNGSNSQLGLPSGLVENCVPGTGTMACTVSGTAPLIPGTYLIELEVFDGFSLGSATATLTVTPPPAEQIFADGFEDQR